MPWGHIPQQNLWDTVGETTGFAGEDFRVWMGCLPGSSGIRGPGQLSKILPEAGWLPKNVNQPISREDRREGWTLSSLWREKEARLKWSGITRGEQCLLYISYRGLWSCFGASEDCAMGFRYGLPLCRTVLGMDWHVYSPEVTWGRYLRSRTCRCLKHSHRTFLDPLLCYRCIGFRLVRFLFVFRASDAFCSLFDMSCVFVFPRHLATVFVWKTSVTFPSFSAISLSQTFSRRFFPFLLFGFSIEWQPCIHKRQKTIWRQREKFVFTWLDKKPKVKTRREKKIRWIWK